MSNDKLKNIFLLKHSSTMSDTVLLQKKKINKKVLSWISSIDTKKKIREHIMCIHTKFQLFSIHFSKDISYVEKKKKNGDFYCAICVKMCTLPKDYHVKKFNVLRSMDFWNKSWVDWLTIQSSGIYFFLFIYDQTNIF